MKKQLLLITAIALGSLGAQTTAKDPYVKSGPDSSPEPGPPPVISICYEDFSLPLAMAAKFQREMPTDSELYRLITAELEKDNVRQESFIVLRSRSGQKATTESISEQIYPTEYEPPHLPESLGVAISPPKKEATAAAPAPEEIRDVDASKLRNAADLSVLKNIATPATPTAFETRNAGLTLGIEANLSASENIVDLRLMPEHVVLVGHSTHGQGLSTTEMPVFESQRINTAITLSINQPAFLGTISRSPDSKQDPDSANRVWFAFVTATLAKP